MNWPTLFSARTAHMRRSTVRELLKLTAQPDMISFAGGLPAPELFPVAEVRAATEAVLKHHGSRALQYGETEGIAELRDWIARTHSMPARPLHRGNILITSGAQQALDLFGRVFLDHGTRVLVENPTYLAALLAWRPLGARIEGLPGGDGGLLPAALEAAIPGARAIYTMPNFQNPRGTTLALTRRRDLVRLARQAGCVILEDDPYGQLRYAGEPLPHLLDIDAAQSSGDPDDWAVIRAGTFSKVLAPGLRIGWVIGPEVVIDKMVQAKQAADLHTSTLNQLIALELAAAGFLDRQIPKLCAAYGQRRDAMFTALARYMPPGIRWTKPEGGMFLFLTLPPGGDATQLLAECLRRQAAYVPGEDFHTDDSGRNTLRLNFSNAAPEMIEEGIRRIAEVFAEGLAAV